MGEATTWLFAAPIWVAVLVYIAKSVKDWPNVMHRWNEAKRDKEAAKEGDWSRLRDEIKRLDDRCDHLQTEVDDCRRREGEWMSRALAAESMLQGRGMARNEVQLLDSKAHLGAKRDGDNK